MRFENCLPLFPTSGRIIKFPNSQALSSTVYNYSCPPLPYIWNEIKFNVAYASDLEFVGRVMQEAAEEEIGAKRRLPLRSVVRLPAPDFLSHHLSRSPDPYACDFQQ
jgi:small-conductance mechanosensitive channel